MKKTYIIYLGQSGASFLLNCWQAISVEWSIAVSEYILVG